MSISDLSGKFIKVSSPEPNVALVELNRQPVNAFSEPYWTEFGRVFDNISGRTDVRAVVISSTIPKIFSGGIDFQALNSMATYDKDPARRALQIRKFTMDFQDAIAATERCPFPVIAAVHGAAIGLSIDMISACDVRYAASNTSFSIKEVDIGLAADIGTLGRLPKLAGNQSLVHELAYTARPFSAVEAEKMGLISKIVEGGREEVLEAALETAKFIATKSPIAVLGTKRILQHARDHSVQQNLEYVATWNGVMVQSIDTTDAIQAAMRKKVPVFKPLGTPPAKL